MSMRAQRKRQAQLKELQSSLAPGKEVITAGGLHGTVVDTHGEQVDLRVKDGTVMTFDTMAIVRSADAPALSARRTPRARSRRRTTRMSVSPSCKFRCARHSAGAFP